MTIEITPTLVAAIATGTVAVVSAVAGGVVSILREIRRTQSQVVFSRQLGQVAGEVRDQKLDSIHDIVNGRYAALERELNDLRATIATGQRDA